MPKFYFTFSDYEPFPYQNGWVEVEAATWSAAIATFNAKYPNPNPHNKHIVNCSCMYDETEFNATNMTKYGNYGAYCHETLIADNSKTGLFIFDDLILEITRKCNMKCDHCLRGNAENINMTMKTIEPLLSRTMQINTLTFTGGEPTLNIPLMKKILNYCKAHTIPVLNIYIVTNGKVVSDNFLSTMIDWYAYCIESNNGYMPDTAGLSLSKDTYHENIPDENINKLKAFTFFDESHYWDFNKYPVLGRGRGANIANNVNRDIITSFSVLPNDDGSIQIDNDTYVSAKGDILADCDLSYDTMPNYTLGNTKNIDEFIKYLRTL